MPKRSAGMKSEGPPGMAATLINSVARGGE